MTASARGLFRATGKASKPVAVRTADGGIVKAAHLERDPHDFRPTPPEPTRALLHAEGARLRTFPTIWEPAAGDGAMVRELRGAGLDVFASDLVDRGCGAEIRDFYAFDLATRPAAVIVTNPPFDQCMWGNGRAAWLIHALDTLRLDYMALLLPWSFPGAAGLAAFWERHRPARAYLMRWRIDFTGQGAAPMLNAWFVWDRAHEGETALRMLDRADARQGELFGEGQEAGSGGTRVSGPTGTGGHSCAS